MKVDSLESVLKKHVTVACNDAGATNIILNWLKAHPEISVRAHLGGPAIELWKGAFPSAQNYGLDEALEGSDQLISGTGWASDLEHKARQAALLKGIFTVAVIDHWVNYEPRFIREGVKILPDEVWLVDEYGCELAKAEFPITRVRLLPNLYLNAQVDAVNLIRREVADTGIINILYALEPIRQDWSENQNTPGEFQALDYFINNISKISDRTPNIRLRAHPSDSPDKYLRWISENNLNVQMSENNTLAQDIAWSDVVAGCQTYVLVVSLTVGKRVICTLPPCAPSSLLPYANIQELRLD